MIHQFVKDQLNNEVPDTDIHAAQELIPPRSNQESRNSIRDESED